MDILTNSECERLLDTFSNLHEALQSVEPDCSLLESLLHELRNKVACLHVPLDSPTHSVIRDARSACEKVKTYLDVLLIQYQIHYPTPEAPEQLPGFLREQWKAEKTRLCLREHIRRLRERTQTQLLQFSSDPEILEKLREILAELRDREKELGDFDSDWPDPEI